MKLIQAKIRGLGTTMETRWFKLNPQLNLFHFSDKESRGDFLRALQTINPPYPCQKTKPFADFPATIKQGKHSRRVTASKRTVALTVFSATPGLVQELAPLSPLLYEVDRIEVGRRLDYSRWINFVELASSSRWSEVEADIQYLLEKYRSFAPGYTTPLADIIKNLQPSDRIKNELQHLLTDWLQEISPKIGEGDKQHLETTLATICRARYFQDARSLVGCRLPLFVVLTAGAEKKETFNRNTAPRSDLLNFATIRTESLRAKSTSSEQIFLDEINKQLAQLKSQGLALQLKKTNSAVSLRFHDHPEQLAETGPQASLRHLQAEACLAVAISRVVYGTDPILLFDEPEQFLPESLHRELADFVLHLSKKCQCLYAYSNANIFPENIAGRQYNAEELSTSRKQTAGAPYMQIDGNR